ncbi:ATP-binding protein [Thiohalocapsa sp. ML1]|jgi:ATP-dependent DNA helicase RecG|uniref:ATP-binding protein n=1 Tax=Thiohalocapsa sp. ML1 TaxID=1431688 RepID=UPI0007322873|nr:ATP-binding protein [Thiohalocapsa sp. ML1]
MSAILPINIRELLHFRGVESARVELKKSWDEKTTGLQVLHAICAFANDFQNLNGGYVVLGVAETGGVAELPPVGLDPAAIEGIQRWIRGRCNQLDPVYQPVLSPEMVDDRHILVIWAPGSESRVHRAPRSLDKGAEHRAYVRLGAETVEAKGDIERELMALTAKVPYDDRRATDVAVEKLRIGRVREFLSDIKSALSDEQESLEVYRRLKIVSPVNGHYAPRNAGLLFFSDDPEEWFRGARIEVVQFAADASGNVLEERVFRGPLHHQLREAIGYLQSLSTQHLQKLPDRPEVKGWVSFPLPAMEEALVNAIYHRSYDGEPEPTKVYLYPDRIEVISYPGPVPGIRPEHLAPGARVPPVPARNRRVGEFLKELRLAEGRGTGIPKVYRAMQQNGSPLPRFSFDTDRTYFQVTLPAHPEYVAIVALRDAAHMRAIGEEHAATERIEAAFTEHPASETLATALIEDLAAQGRLTGAAEVFDRFMASPGSVGGARPIIAFAKALLDDRQDMEAKRILDKLPAMMSAEAASDAAIAERRAGRQELAHRYFDRAGDEVYRDVRALHEFAQTKIWLAEKQRQARPKKRTSPYQRDARQRLLREAQEMLKRVLQMDAPPTRLAWAWFDLGRVLNWMRAPWREIERAFNHAIDLQPNEVRFRETFDRIRAARR